MRFLDILAPVFLIVLCGALLQRRARLDLQPLTISALYLFAPALTFSALIKQPLDGSALGRISLYMLLYLAIMLLLASLTGRLLGCDGDSRRALTLAAAMMNIGNFGLPLVYFAFGEAAVATSILVFVLFSLPLGSLAIVIAQGSQADWRSALRNSLQVPIIHAALLALLLQALHLQPPAWLLRPVDLLGQAAVPVMLLLLGMQMARSRWQQVGRLLPAAISLRLLIGPLVGYGLCRLLQIEGLLRDVLLLQTSTPAAVLPLLYALRFGTRPDLLASAIIATTALSALSLTALLYLLPLLP